MCFYDFADKNYVHSAPKTVRGRPNGVSAERENSDGVRGSLLPLLRLPVCLRGKCESVCLVSNQWKQSDKLPVGWKICPD